jgi:PAS domain-containing protein
VSDVGGWWLIGAGSRGIVDDSVMADIPLIGEGTVQPCGCPTPPLVGVYGLIDPASEVLIELDERDVVVGGFPHHHPLLTGAICGAAELGALLPREVARLIVDRAGVVRAAGRPTSVEVSRPDLRIRVAPREVGVHVVLRGEEHSAPRALARTTVSEDSFWQLFDAAPVPLAIEIAATPTGMGASRFNRRFTEVFGYDATDIPTVQHWWPLAYPDEAFRAIIRDEWFRRVQGAIASQSSIDPMQATVQCKDGTQRDIEFFAAAVGDRHVVVFVDLTERNRAARQLREAREEVQALSTLLPVCAWCKRLRDDEGYWQLLEEFVKRRTGATVTHGICDDCRARHFVSRR